MTVFWCATSAPRVAILSLCACSCACILACSSFRAMLWCAIDPSVYHLGGSGRSICLTSQRSSRYIFILSSKIKDAETSPRTCVSASFSQMIIARTLSDRRIRRSNRTAIGGRAEQDPEVSRAICALALCPVHFPYICVCSRPSRILCGASECI